jgi:archaellum component FlaC
MANHEWDNASTDKKLEMLRADIERIYTVVSTLASDVAATHRTVRANDSLLKEVAKAVEAIERKLPASAKKK